MLGESQKIAYKIKLFCMNTYPLLLFFFIPSLSFAQSVKESGDTGKTQFVLFDVEFTYTKADADNSTPSKSHYYVTGDKLKPEIPKNWTSPVDYRNGTVHIRIEVKDKPAGSAPTTWTLCYIPNKGKGNGYGCTGTGCLRKKACMKEMYR